MTDLQDQVTVCFVFILDVPGCLISHFGCFINVLILWINLYLQIELFFSHKYILCRRNKFSIVQDDWSIQYFKGSPASSVSQYLYLVE